MNITKLLVFLAAIVVMLGASYMYERVHRYDVVVAGAGGSQDTNGTIGGYLIDHTTGCLLYTSPSPRDLSTSRMPSSA